MSLEFDISIGVWYILNMTTTQQLSADIDEQLRILSIDINVYLNQESVPMECYADDIDWKITRTRREILRLLNPTITE